MIVQTASPNQPHFVMTQIDHARLSGEFAAAFGNEIFSPLNPEDPMVYVAAHHDDGWDETDAACLMDSQTGLPFHLTQTPLTELVKTSARSPQSNEDFHPYSGLMSSMHTYGLFNGRYGLSDKIFIDLIPTEHKQAVEAMLAKEVARQARIKANFLGSAEAHLVSEDTLFSNYKLLQFFDTLALYFHMVHPAARGISTFLNVPRSIGQDVVITLEPVADDVFALDPYPFRETDLNFSFAGRYLTPQPPGTDLKQVMAETPVTRQSFTLVDRAVQVENDE